MLVNDTVLCRVSARLRRSYNELIVAYSKVGCPEKCKILYDALLLVDDPVRTGTAPSQYVVNEIRRRAGIHGIVEEIEALLAQRPEGAAATDASRPHLVTRGTFDCMIRAMGNVKRMSEAVSVFEHLERVGKRLQARATMKVTTTAALGVVRVSSERHRRSRRPSNLEDVLEADNENGDEDDDDALAAGAEHDSDPDSAAVRRAAERRRREQEAHDLKRGAWLLNVLLDFNCTANWDAFVALPEHRSTPSTASGGKRRRHRFSMVPVTDERSLLVFKPAVNTFNALISAFGHAGMDAPCMTAVSVCAAVASVEVDALPLCVRVYVRRPRSRSR